MKVFEWSRDMLSVGVQWSFTHDDLMAEKTYGELEDMAA